MRIWRISNYADLSGHGGRLLGGRWNHLGAPVVYCSDHPATALLEILARIDRFDVPRGYRLLVIEVPDDAPARELNQATLPPDWKTSAALTQTLGTRLLEQAACLSIRVPCVLVPFAWNVLLNPRHADINRCSIVETIEGAFDPRLIR